MADIANDVKCTDCNHLASMHTDTADGANTGSCTADNCDCEKMATATTAAGDPDAPAPEAATTIETLQVTGDAAGGTSAGEGDASGLLTAITTAQSAVAAVTSPPVWVEQASGLLDAAGAAAAGLSDDDGKRWAQATDAAIDAALELTETAEASPPDDVAAAVAAIKALDEAMDAYLAAQGIDDPDESEGAADSEGSDDAEGDAVTAAGEEGMTPWDIPVLVIEGVATGDGRFIQAEALAACELPATLMALDENGDFHDGAFPVGRIDTMERYDASALTNPKTGEAYGEGVFAWKAAGAMTSADIAAQIITLVREKVLTGVSADLRDTESILELLNDDGTVEEGVDPMDLDEDAFWDALDAGKIQETVTKGRIMGATVCPFPAFEGAYIEIGSGDDAVATPVAASGSSRHTLRFHDVYGLRQCAACEEGSMVAAAAPMEPPAEWFDDPQFTGITPLAVQEDGRVYGHMAAWGTCHTGVTGRCVTPPRNKSDYAYFRTGSVRTDDGELVRVGQLTVGTGHASLQADARSAVEHYDNTGSAVADVATGEDRFGIWVAGALRPDATELQVRQLRASAISGDWRNIGGRLEMVGALAVNVPGFPVVRARVASGAEQALVAAGGRGVIAGSQAALRELLAFKAMAEPEILESRADRLRRSVHTA